MARFGSIGTQYFDDQGDPLVDGKLYFYEPGTTTRKNTFADVTLGVANTNPVRLSAAGRQPNIFFNGTARAVLTDLNGVQLESKDPVGGDVTDGAFADWNSEGVYDVPDIVVGSDGNFYVSLSDGNEGNAPSSSPLYWTQIRFIRVWNVNETYTEGQVAEGSDGLVYSSTADSNLGNDPVTDAVNWKPASTGGGGGIAWTYKTTDYVIANGEGVVVDSAGADRTVTAPAAIAAGHSWTISHLNTSGTAALVTFARNGHTLRRKGVDVADDITLADGDALTIVCTSATNMEII